MLSTLTYSSTPTTQLTSDNLNRLKTEAETNNELFGITGCLLVFDGRYIQTIEGTNRAVNTLYGKLLEDVRHTDVRLIYFSQTDKRSYQDWLFVESIDSDILSSMATMYGNKGIIELEKMTTTAIIQLVHEVYVNAKMKTRMNRRVSDSF